MWQFHRIPWYYCSYQVIITQRNRISGSPEPCNTAEKGSWVYLARAIQKNARCSSWSLFGPNRRSQTCLRKYVQICTNFQGFLKRTPKSSISIGLSIINHPAIGIVKSAAKHLLRHDVPSWLAEIAEPPVDVSAMDLYITSPRNGADTEQFQVTKQNSGKAYLGLSDNRVPQNPVVVYDFAQL